MGMAHATDLSVVAERVETSAQLDALRASAATRPKPITTLLRKRQSGLMSCSPSLAPTVIGRGRRVQKALQNGDQAPLLWSTRSRGPTACARELNVGRFWSP